MEENCLTQEGVEPEGQVFFHGQQAGVMAVRQPLVVLLRTGEARPRVSVLLPKKTVHPQPGQVPRAQRTAEAGVHLSHFTVHASAPIGFQRTLVDQNIDVCFMLFLGFDFDILHESYPYLGLSHPLQGRQDRSISSGKQLCATRRTSAKPSS